MDRVSELQHARHVSASRQKMAVLACQFLPAGLEMGIVECWKIENSKQEPAEDLGGSLYEYG